MVIFVYCLGGDSEPDLGQIFGRLLILFRISFYWGFLDFFIFGKILLKTEFSAILARLVGVF